MRAKDSACMRAEDPGLHEGQGTGLHEGRGPGLQNVDFSRFRGTGHFSPLAGLLILRQF